MGKILEINGLTFGYKKESLLFKDFSITLKKGEIKAIVGASGAGKSTLFDLITKSIKPFSGSIKSSSYSQVFQDPYSSFHPSYSLLNQISDVATLDSLDSYLEKINLDYELLLKLPHELSGGQLQRASILRALMMQKELLLLDEPTSALDNVIQLEIMSMLVKNLSSVGMLLITHDLELAKWCADEIVMI